MVPVFCTKDTPSKGCMPTEYSRGNPYAPFTVTGHKVKLACKPGFALSWRSTCVMNATCWCCSCDTFQHTPHDGGEGALTVLFASIKDLDFLR